jgi:hypothetical protein
LYNPEGNAPVGPQGFQGIMGNQGYQGVIGNQGLTGSQGNLGNQGNIGNQGVLGNQGNQGVIGIQGNQGNIGLQGIQGNQGIIGNQGNLGSQGTQGNLGNQGNQGLIGNQGNQGNVNIIQKTNVTILSASWNLVSGLYEYVHSDVDINSTSIVDVIPNNADIDIVINAEILPQIVGSSGNITIFAKKQPTSNFNVTLNIIN